MMKALSWSEAMPISRRPWEPRTTKEYGTGGAPNFSSPRVSRRRATASAVTVSRRETSSADTPRSMKRPTTRRELAATSAISATVPLRASVAVA